MHDIAFLHTGQKTVIEIESSSTKIRQFRIIAIDVIATDMSTTGGERVFACN